jgi:feruloyl esterase
MQHCGNGPGPNNFNAAPALISWVLTGVAPEQIIAAHFQDNNPTGPVTRTMPLCPYPEVAVFTGGDVNMAANWVCQRHANQPLSLGPEE